MSEISQQLGKDGEQLVCRHFEEQGFLIIKRNFQFYSQGVQGRLGEIDLICEKNNKLHLVEIKTRSSLQFGNIAGQVTVLQLKKLYKTYQYFLKKEPRFKSYFCQFDVATVYEGKIEIIPNAYTFDGFY